MRTANQPRWLSPAESRAREQQPRLPPSSAPPLLFPGPMEGQAVPAEHCQACALTPTILSNPPMIHPPAAPWPALAPCLLASGLALAPPRPHLLSPRRGKGWPRALLSTVSRLGTCLLHTEPGTEGPTPGLGCPLPHTILPPCPFSLCWGTCF